MSSTVALAALPSLLAACIALLIGSVLTDRVSLLARFSIPAPIVGGLLVATAMLLLQNVAGLRFTLETSTKSTLLLIFFASIGLTADLSLLRRGGPRLVRCSHYFPSWWCRTRLASCAPSCSACTPCWG